MKAPRTDQVKDKIEAIKRKHDDDQEKSEEGPSSVKKSNLVKDLVLT